MPDLSIDQLLDQGVVAQSAGDLSAAERCYRAVLQINAQDTDALHLMGIIHHQQGRRQEALEFLSQAVALAPDAALFHFNLAEALRADEVFAAAATHYLLAVELDASMTAAYLPLAESLASVGRENEAAAHLPKVPLSTMAPADLLRIARCANKIQLLDLAVDAATRASQLAPDNLEALDLLANVLTRASRFAPLVDIYQRLITLDPMDRYYIGVASAYAECRDYDSAKTAAFLALELFPNAHDAHFILGHCAERQAEWLVAARHYAEVLKFDPRHVPSLVNSAVALRCSGRPLEALDCLTEAQKYTSESFELFYNFAFSYENLGRNDEAIAMCRKALELNPDHAPSINLLGSALQKSRRSGEACDILEPFIRQNPNDRTVHCTLASIYLDRGELSKTLDSFRRSIDPAAPQKAVDSNVLLTATYDDTLSPRELFDLHVAWGLQQPTPDSPPPAIANRKHSKIRVGYVSGDFRTHSVAFFVCPILMFHDQSTFDIYCYANVQNPDKVTQMFQSLGHQWRHIAGLTDDRAFELIRQDEIDILVDLAGHTGGTRLSLFAKRPAPIQVGMIGYPCTTGLPAIDYQITDSIIHPPGLNEPLATEKLVRLPQIFACYRPPDNAPPVQPLPALTLGRITFGYFNNLAKLRESVLRAWARIAEKLPTATFVIQTGALDDPAAHEITRQRCIDAGIPADSLDIRGQSTLARFHDDLNTIDIVLDPFPFNGHTTSCQILHMGVPIVTLSGKTRSSRMGATLLHNLGLPHLIAHSPQEYADIAVRLAKDLPALATLRSSLRSRMESSPIMNAPLYTHHLENAYREMIESARNAER